MADMSDTPAGMIARLDDALTRRGRTVTVKKHDSVATATVKANVRAAKEDEIAGLAQQVWSKVVLSPTGLADVLPLRKGDRLVWADKAHAIEMPAPIYVADVLVRIELIVAG